MLPDVHIGRDALVAAALTLQHLAVRFVKLLLFSDLFFVPLVLLGLFG